MSWVTPITDRGDLDIVNRTSKAYFNVADWNRIRDNNAVVMNLVNLMFGTSLTPDGISGPSTPTIPNAPYFNLMIHDIARACVASGFATAPRYDWPDDGTAAPNYVDVNGWERALLDIYNRVHLSADGFAYCGVASVGMDFVNQNGFIILYP